MRMLKKEVSTNRTLSVAILSTLIMVLYAQFILGHFSNCFSIDEEANSLGLSFGYSTAEVYAFFDVRTEGQLLCYTNFLRVWDSIFPLLYTTMYLCWTIYLFKRWLFLSIIPVMHMITDWLENYYEISMVNEYLRVGEISDQLVSTSSIITMTKWGLSVLTYTILVSGIIYKLKLYITTPKPH
jgi:hypothetical protein